MQINVNAEYKDLSAELRNFIDNLDLSNKETTVFVKPPSLIYIFFAAVLFLIYFCGFAFFSYAILFLDTANVLTPVIFGLVLTGLLGLIFGYSAASSIYKRLHPEKYYICMAPDALVERRKNKYTVIPSHLFVSAHGSGAGGSLRGVRYARLNYKMENGSPGIYILRGYYLTEKNMSADLVEMMRKLYKIDTPYHIHKDFVSDDYTGNLK